MSSADVLKWCEELEERVKQLEKHIHFPNTTAALGALKEAGVRAQAMRGREDADKVPMRTDVETIRTLTAFAKRLLNTEDFGHAVTFEVRQAARRALGLPEVKEYDL